MASVGSLSSSTTSSVYGSTSKGLAGLVSGMDTDTLIDGMTIGTRTKIAKQKQNKQILEWKMDSYRSVTTKLVDFANKYTSYSSSTNLYSESFFSKSSITTSGTNSKYVSVTGSSNTTSNISINAVEKLAANASFTSSSAVSGNVLSSGEINYGDRILSTISGQSLKIKYGSSTYTVTVPEKDGGGVYTSADEIAQALQKAMEDITLDSEVNGKTKLSEVMTIGESDGKLVFSQDASDTSGNSLSISGGNSSLLKTLGLTSGSETIVGETIKGSLSAKEAINTADLTKTTTFIESMKDKTMTFSYNGVSKTITFDDESKLNSTDFAGYLESKLTSAFGSKRIKVTDNNGKLEIKTKTTDGNDDTSSVLKITSASSGLLGTDGIFGVKSGTSNKVNQSAALENSGLQGVESANLVEGKQNIRINGKDIEIEYTKGKTTLADVISAINNSDAGVNISYLENSDKFSVVSTESGASGDVTFGDESTGELNNLEKVLFGKKNSTTGDIVAGNDLNGTKIDGQDAVVWVDYDGEGGSDPVKITRGTNTFTIDGLSISVNGKFGCDASGNVIEGEQVKLNASVDTDKVVSAVKSMIDDYNTMVDYVNSTVSEKRDRDYAPLTDEQKADMSESEIEAWNEKAKAGMLFNDSDLLNLTSDLRFVFLNANKSALSFKDIGITVSSSWQDNGKITFDEDAFKSALSENPEEVQQMFTQETQSGENTMTSGGAMTRMKALTDKYASTTGATKGILIEKAGHSSSPVSLLQNSILTQMNDINDIISNLEDKLETEQTRYQKQFTALEQLVQNMNTQSSYLSQMFSS